MMWVKSYFHKNILEISKDSVLVFSGIMLFVVNILTGYDWINTRKYELFDSSNYLVSCFPFFNNCYDYVNNDIINVYYVFWLMIILSLLGILLFLVKQIRYAYFLLILTTVIKLAIFSSRYNLMGNFHTMHFVIAYAYMFFTYKRNIFLILVCILYFSAGLLKFNSEWVSGASLLNDPWFSGEILLLLTAYVIVLETFLIWGLLYKDKRIWILVTIQLAIFHTYSWFIVGYFYPLTMLCLLTPLYLSVSLNDYKFFEYKQLTKAAWIYVIFVLMSNVIPKIIYDETSLDGYRRFFSLNMLDARTNCTQIPLLIKDNEVSVIASSYYTRAVRTACDPIHFDDYLKRICKEDKSDSNVAFFLESKRSTSSKYTVIRDIKNACK